MNPFSASAAIYDSLYSDKEYLDEINNVLKLAHRYSNVVDSVISFGCGTGRYETILASMGKNVYGIDISPEMISRATSRKNSLSKEELDLLTFKVGDFSTFQSDTQYDLAISLFHVVNYLTTHDKFLGALETAFRVLKSGGLFIFDSWHGPGIIKDPPASRRKEVSSESGYVIREAKPIHDPKQQLISVNYEYTVKPLEQKSSQTFSEVHKMRYLFPEEVRNGLLEVGFDDVSSYSSFEGLPLSDDSWNAVYVARKK